MRLKHLLRCSESHYCNWVPELMPFLLMGRLNTLELRVLFAIFTFLFFLFLLSPPHPWNINLNWNNAFLIQIALITALRNPSIVLILPHALFGCISPLACYLNMQHFRRGKYSSFVNKTMGKRGGGKGKRRILCCSFLPARWMYLRTEVSTWSLSQSSGIKSHYSLNLLFFLRSVQVKVLMSREQNGWALSEYGQISIDTFFPTFISVKFLNFGKITWHHSPASNLPKAAYGKVNKTSTLHLNLKGRPPGTHTHKPLPA